jgi:hypothetical protein
LARLYVLEATIEILKTENEILKRRLAAAETWAAQAVHRPRADPRELCPARRRSVFRLNRRPGVRARPWWRRLAG